MLTEQINNTKVEQTTVQESFTNSLKRLTQQVFGQGSFDYGQHSLAESIGYICGKDALAGISIGYMTGNEDKVYLTFRDKEENHGFIKMAKDLQRNPRIYIVPLSINAEVKALIIHQSDKKSLAQVLEAFKTHMVEAKTTPTSNPDLSF